MKELSDEEKERRWRRGQLADQIGEWITTALVIFIFIGVVQCAQQSMEEAEDNRLGAKRCKEIIARYKLDEDCS